MPVELYGFLAAFMVLLIIAEFAGSVWSFFWAYVG